MPCPRHYTPLAPAVTAALFMLTARATAQAQDQGASLAYAVPPGWTQSVNPNTGLIALMPRDVPRGGVCVLNIFSPEPFSGSPDAFHDEIVRRATGGGRLLEPPRHGAVGAFLVTTIHALAPNGIPLWFTIYTARWGDRGQAFLLAVNAEELARRYSPVADAMVRRIAVPQLAGAEPPPTAAGRAAAAPLAPPPCLRPTGIEICPKAVPQGDQAVRIVGAYIAAGARTSYSVDPGDPGVRSRVGTTILLLFANGVAARTSAMKAGAIDDTYWSEGFATMDPRDPAQLGARRAGRWSERSGTITITWQIGAPMTLTRDGNNLRESSTLWTPYPAVDGLRLDGRYERVVEFGPAWAITFRRDGTFESQGLNNTMGGTVVNPGFPEQGSGTYEIAKWSLILRFTTGFVQSINLMVGQGSPAEPADLVLNGHDYVRTRGRP